MKSVRTIAASGSNTIPSVRLRNFLTASLKTPDFSGQKILLIIPDSTRSGPFGMFVKEILRIIKPVSPKVDILIALGTHAAMSKKQIDRFLGLSGKDHQGLLRDVKIFNHEWDNPKALRTAGVLEKSTIRRLTGGLFEERVPVTVNAKIFGYDRIIVLGPVFPHEVVGFSGGWKYFFPGICGPDFLNFFHWLGAVITNVNVNGVIDTPVRDVIHKAARFIKIPCTLVALDVHKGHAAAVFVGDMISAWRKAARRAARTHIRTVTRRWNRVIGIAPEFYDDLWTAGKAMYKLESAVADGGELVIYAPHVTEVSYTHGRILDRIGYHVRDFFLRQWKIYRKYPRGLLAHSTHVKGTGTFENGIERPRIRVTLATGIPKQRCDRINLGFTDHRSLDLNALRKNKDVLVVDNAGEILYRYRRD
jgi:nickel-dependent lactate racemase